MRIKEIKKVLTEINFFRKTLKKYGSVMRRGKYYLFSTMRAAVLNNLEFYNAAVPYFYKKTPDSLRKNLITIINKIGFLNNKQKSEQKYDAFYVANNYDASREVKLFSFSERKILTICANRNDYSEQVRLYDELGEWYNLPKVEECHLYENSYKISMIELKERPTDEYAIKEILFATMKYNTQGKCNKSIAVKDLVIANYENDELNVILQRLISEISSEVLNVSLPCCEQHGDLSRDNLIYGISEDKEAFWWIDWEHRKSRVFFYDFYFYILNTAVYIKDTFALESYLKGDYNEELKIFFNSFGVEFSSDKLIEYFLVFVISFLKERVCDLNNIIALKMYCENLIKLKLLTEGCSI